ncbi:ATP-binding protein [Streptomyces sp. NPDC055144]
MGRVRHPISRWGATHHHRAHDPAGGRSWPRRQLPRLRPERAQADDLYELVSARQAKSLIITSNRSPSDWYPLFPNPVVAESLLDRVISTSHQVIMNGPSYRPNKRPRNGS